MGEWSVFVNGLREGEEKEREIEREREREIERGNK